MGVKTRSSEVGVEKLVPSLESLFSWYSKKRREEAFLLTVGAFWLTVEVLGLQSTQVPIKGTFHL